MRIGEAARQLLIAEAVSALEFFVCHTDGKTHGFTARCWPSLNELEDADDLVKELNEAIRPVREKWVGRLLSQVQESFPQAGERK